MQAARKKSRTDLHWDERAKNLAADEKVNIGDTVQRELETAFVLSILPENARILEVGCGNGYLTQILREKADFVDAFDFAEHMIVRAKQYAGEKNNRFFCDDVLAPAHVTPPYDVIVCVRVLINLRNQDEQIRAVENLAGLLKPGGKLILIEGYSNGFAALSKVRTDAGLPPLTPAPINFYASFEALEPALTRHFTTGATFHSGMFDFLTRVVYPLLAGADGVKEAGEFHVKTLPLARSFNPDNFKGLARLRGLELIKR